eukprot:GFYU01003122.1.p2 GENE.GFYU01003122.1~~GFYU01003122.1.p2  ORF type:complete len:388 (+),score=136.38 GFYU01003122.1:130-1293(+)
MKSFAVFTLATALLCMLAVSEGANLLHLRNKQKGSGSGAGSSADAKAKTQDKVVDAPQCKIRTSDKCIAAGSAPDAPKIRVEPEDICRMLLNQYSRKKGTNNPLKIASGADFVPLLGKKNAQTWQAELGDDLCAAFQADQYQLVDCAPVHKHLNFQPQQQAPQPLAGPQPTNAQAGNGPAPGNPTPPAQPPPGAAPKPEEKPPAGGAGGAAGKLKKEVEGENEGADLSYDYGEGESYIQTEVDFTRKIRTHRRGSGSGAGGGSTPPPAAGGTGGGTFGPDLCREVRSRMTDPNCGFTSCMAWTMFNDVARKEGHPPSGLYADRKPVTFDDCCRKMLKEGFAFVLEDDDLLPFINGGGSAPAGDKPAGAPPKGVAENVGAADGGSGTQ